MDELDPRVAEALKQYDIEADVFVCEPEFADTAQFCEKYGFKPEESANTILIVNKKNLDQVVACVVLANTRLDVNKKVCQLMETKKASFASAEQTVAKTNMMIGGVVAIGLPKDMQIYIDEKVMNCDKIIMGGGNRSTKLVLKPQELTKLPHVHIIENLTLPVPS